jgi:membrane dipeptidase
MKVRFGQFNPMLRYLDHLTFRLGEDQVGFGSDFDGAQVPKAMADVAGLGAFYDALCSYRFDAKLLEKLCYGNWLCVLDRNWKA